MTSGYACFYPPIFLVVFVIRFTVRRGNRCGVYFFHYGDLPDVR